MRQTGSRSSGIGPSVELRMIRIVRIEEWDTGSTPNHELTAPEKEN
jgi:hypothetical protein